MKKRSITMAIVLIVFVGLLTGIVYLFNDVFPKAKPIRYPKPNEITSITPSCEISDEIIHVSEEHYENLIQYIGEAKPTRKQSLNDYPTTFPYYIFEIQTSEMQYRYFIYEEDRQVYIESPYEGIYESNTELWDLVLKYFEEG